MAIILCVDNVVTLVVLSSAVLLIYYVGFKMKFKSVDVPSLGACKEKQPLLFHMFAPKALRLPCVGRYFCRQFLCQITWWLVI
jgi:hypothetical protein